MYTVRKRADGEFILTTEDGCCTCGDTAFRELASKAEAVGPGTR